MDARAVQLATGFALCKFADSEKGDAAAAAVNWKPGCKGQIGDGGVSASIEPAQAFELCSWLGSLVWDNHYEFTQQAVAARSRTASATAVAYASVCRCGCMYPDKKGNHDGEGGTRLWDWKAFRMGKSHSSNQKMLCEFCASSAKLGFKARWIDPWLRVRFL